MTPLYQEIQQQLEPTLPWPWSSELRGRLMTLVLGVLLSKSTSPRQMAKSLVEYGYTQAEETSVERQVRRIENDERLSAEACLHPFAKHYLLLGKPKELVLIIDATTHTDKVCLLMVSVRYRGQALPLAWNIWLANQRLKGAGFWMRVAQVLATVADLLPYAVPVTWLADRAFGCPVFIDLVQAYGWHFVVRVQGQTRYRDRIGRERRLDHCLDKKRRFKGGGQVFKSSKWRTLSVVVLRSRDYPSPLCLVSNLPAHWALGRLYRWRYNIETLFRSYKSEGWDWEKSQVRDLVHVERLLLGMALASWLCLLLGTQVADELLSQPATGKRRTPPPQSHSSLFQLGYSRLKAWAVGNFSRPLRFWLTHWDAPNWETHITQHHLYAFVMGSFSSFVKLRPSLNSSVRP
jgi:hypothetical protein